jgi:hypothetical protein
LLPFASQRRRFAGYDVRNGMNVAYGMLTACRYLQRFQAMEIVQSAAARAILANSGSDRAPVLFMIWER